MKLIGFIKGHDNIEEAKEYALFQRSDSIADSEIEAIANYLDDGVFIFGWMGYCYDLDDDTPIAPDSYYTDGIYVWPAYFPYYLRKHPNSQVDERFLAHISKNDFRIDKSKIDSPLKERLELELLKITARK